MQKRLLSSRVGLLNHNFEKTARRIIDRSPLLPVAARNEEILKMFRRNLDQEPDLRLAFERRNRNPAVSLEKPFDAHFLPIQFIR